MLECSTQAMRFPRLPQHSLEFPNFCPPTVHLEQVVASCQEGISIPPIQPKSSQDQQKNCLANLDGGFTTAIQRKCQDKKELN